MTTPIRLGLVVLLAGASARGEDVTPYLPIGPGATWTYAVTKDRVTTLAGKDYPEQLNGLTVESVVRPSGRFAYAAPVWVLSQHLTEEDQASGRKTDATLENHVSVERGQVLIHGQAVLGAAAMDSALVRFEPPVAWLKLPLPAAGAPYPSAMTTHGMTVDARPIARAEATVRTPAGRFDCLRIAMRGPVSGRIPAAAPMRILDGAVDDTLWFAKGVGVVREVQVLTITIELPNGAPAVSRERKVKELTQYAVPKAAGR